MIAKLIRLISKQTFSLVLILALLLGNILNINLLSAPLITSVSPISADISGGSTITINGSGFIQNVVGGNLDTSFDVGTGANGIVYASAVQNDGKIIIGGGFSTYNGIARSRIARLNSDGSLDTSFVVGGGANNNVLGISIQTDGKIIIVGQFTNYSGTGRNRIARLNTDGSLDTSFVVGSGANNIIYAAAIQPDGKILIGGQFTSYNGTSKNRIARLNTNGTLEAAFNTVGGAQNIIRTISLQTDGKIIIGGTFTAYSGTGRNRLARLNTNGSLDNTFVVGTGLNSTVFATSIQSDGKIIIGGQFATYNGTGRNRIARLNIDGSLDLTFVVGTGGNNTVFTTSLQSDGKIIIGGQFTTYNGIGRNRIARVNTDGSLDTSFVVGTGASDIVYSTTIQPDGKIIIGGNFTNYNDTSINRIARLNGEANTISAFIGTNACTTLVFNSSTQLTCTVPPGLATGFVDVIVTNPDFESFVFSNQFQYTAPVFLAFQIRNSDDTASSNTCDLGIASTASVSSCSYRLKVSTNITNGYHIFVTTSGDLVGNSSSIQNANVGSGGGGGTTIDNSTAGTENYGVRIVPGNATGGSVSLNPVLNAGTNSVRFNYTGSTSLLETTGPNNPASVDTVNTALVTHNFNISTGTIAGQYTQSVTYTIVPKF